MAKRTGDIELAGEITTPDGSVAGDSGQDFIITAGAGLTTGDGGDITLTPGAAPGAGSPGAIVIPQTTAPTVTTNKLYNVGGDITWNGAVLNQTSAGGSNTQIQYNNSGIVDGILGFYYTLGSNNILAQSASAPSSHWFEINSNNLTAGNNVLKVRSSSNIATGAVVHIEHSATPGGMPLLKLNGVNNAGDLIDGQASGTSVFVVDDEGYITTYPGTPADTEVLAWSTANGRFEPTTIGGGGDVTKVGTPVNNQIGVWTGDGTIEGTVGLTYNGTTLATTGDVTATGTFLPTGSVGGADAAAIGLSATSGLMLIGTGSVDDIAAFNTSGSIVWHIPTGTVNTSFNGAINAVAGSTARPSINIAEGVAPSSPVDGDVWVTAGGAFFARLNGVTVDLSASSGAFTETGTNNIHSGTFTGSGDSNFMALDGAGDSLTTGLDNILIGGDAGTAITTGRDNTAVGQSSLSQAQAVSSGQNSGFGKNSGASITSGTFNTAIGYGAMSGAQVITGSNNISLGANAFADNPATVSGDDNIGIGEFAGRAITSASNSIAIGMEALGHTAPSATGDDNIAIGRTSMAAAAITTAANNVGVGFATLSRVTTSSWNVAIGDNAGQSLTLGNNNVAIGRDAMASATSAMNGNNNIAIGQDAMTGAATAAISDNIAFGNQALKNLSTGDHNFGVGSVTGEEITTGSENIMIGRSAGPTTNQSSRLYINNTKSDTPLIFGDFSTSEVIVNGTLEVTDGITMPLASQTQTGTTYTAVLADADKMITLDNAAAITMTIPANASVAYPVGTKLNFLQLGAGQVTVAITTDTLNVESTLTLKLAGQYAAATAFKVTSTTWVLFGNLEAA